MGNIYHYLAPLPTSISEIVVPCYDGYTVYTADWLSTSERIEAYNHAISHIKNNDWEKSNVQEIEYEAHKRE